MSIGLLAYLIVLTVLRLVYIGQMGLLPDEAYYHEWSQRLDWWYFSKGPGIALLMRLSTAIFGHGEFGVRFFAPIFGLGTSLLVYWLAQRLYDRRIAFWTVVMMCVTPIFNVGALAMTIDAPSIFFWAAALCTLWLALEKSPAFSGWWPLTGILIGVGFLFKMTNAAMLASVLLLLAMTGRYRRELIGPGFWSMVMAFIPFVVPMVWWNQARGWPTTSHLAARGGLETAWYHFDFESFFTFIGVHFGVYSPLIFFLMMMALVATVWPSFLRWASAWGRVVFTRWGSTPVALGLWVSGQIFHFGWLLAVGVMLVPVGLALFLLENGAVHWKPRLLGTMGFLMVTLSCWMAGNFFELSSLHKMAVWLAVLAALLFVGCHKEAANMHWKSRFLAAFALPLLLAYLWIALHHDAEPNWTAPASVSLAILAVAYGYDRVARGVRGARLFVVLGLILGALISAVAVNTDLLRAAGVPLSFKRDPSARLRGWREVAERLHEFRKTIEQQSGQKVFLIANSYGTASAIAYYLPEKRIEVPGHPAVYVPESPVAENQYHFWGRYDEYEERKAPIINDQEDSREYGLNRFAGRTAIYVTDREYETVPIPLLRMFERWELKTTFEFAQGGLPLRTVRVFLCYRYKPGTMLD